MVQKKKSPTKKPVKAESKAAKVKKAKAKTTIENPAVTPTESDPMPKACEPAEERDLIEGTDYTIEDLLDAIAARNSAKYKQPEPEIEEADDEETARLESILENIDRTLAAGGITDLEEYERRQEAERKEAEMQRRLHELAIDEMLNEE